MRIKKDSSPRWIVKVKDISSDLPCDAKENDIRFVQVGNKLISHDFIEGLLEHVDGKVVVSPFVIDVSELIDEEFMSFNVDSLLAVTGECFAHLFNTNRIVINQE